MKHSRVFDFPSSNTVLGWSPAKRKVLDFLPISLFVKGAKLPSPPTGIKIG